MKKVLLVLCGTITVLSLGLCLGSLFVQPVISQQTPNSNTHQTVCLSYGGAYWEWTTWNKHGKEGQPTTEFMFLNARGYPALSPPVSDYFFNHTVRYKVGEKLLGCHLMKSSYQTWSVGGIPATGQGWTIILPLWPLIFLGLWPARHIQLWRQQEHRRKFGLCLQCGYNLTGNVSGKCSECGHPTPANSHGVVGVRFLNYVTIVKQ